MPSKRYTLIIADQTTGVLRRVTIAWVPALALFCALFSLPVLVGLGAHWSAGAELDQLRLSNALLRQENDSFRSATGALTDQISALQSTVFDLSDQGATDPSTRLAISKLPALVRGQARGGSREAQNRALLSAALQSPEDTFGVLKDVLGALESRLTLVRGDLRVRTELARATPSIWPALGWLTSGFGYRADPFTGRPDSHVGLDIAADRGAPVYATASGVVRTSGWQGDYGQLVSVEHAFGLMTRYGHLSKIAVPVGATVKRGDILGYVGATGRATSPHLHYEVWADGRPVNPLKLLAGRPEK
jgi:murein DD-endopeptidase MepM/ murein hydrolase activator NlpD